jgi:uncharacterized membrane protein
VTSVDGDATSGFPRHSDAIAVAIVAAAIVVGGALRLSHLDAKLFWHDETYTALRSAGYTTTEMVAVLFDGHEAAVDEVARFQRASARPVSATLQSLATEDSEHPPLYFVLTRWWMRTAGDSAQSIRGLSVLFGVAALPLIWWLAREMFPGQATASISVALMAVSPFFVQYSQEARQYTLWTATVLAATAALLRALRSTTYSAWALYAAASVVGLYTQFLFVLVLAAHAVSVAICHRGSTRRFSAAVVAAAVAFGPWALAMAHDFGRSYAANGWMRAQTPWWYIGRSWAANLSSVVVATPGPDSAPGPLTWAALAVVLGAFAALIHDPYRSGARLLLLLAGASFLALAVPDLIFGGGRSTVARYLVPCLVAAVLAVARVLARLVEHRDRHLRRVGHALACGLVVVSALSTANMVAADRWTRDDGGRVSWDIVNRINAAPAALVVLIRPWPTNVGDALTLSRELRPHVRFQLAPSVDAVVSAAGREMFVLNPTVDERRLLETQIGIALEPLSTYWWRASSEADENPSR